MIGVTHAKHDLSHELLEQVIIQFNQFVGDKCARFLQSIPVGLLRKPGCHFVSDYTSYQLNPSFYLADVWIYVVGELSEE